MISPLRAGSGLDVGWACGELSGGIVHIVLTSGPKCVMCPTRECTTALREVGAGIRTKSDASWLKIQNFRPGKAAALEPVWRGSALLFHSTLLQLDLASHPERQEAGMMRSGFELSSCFREPHSVFLFFFSDVLASG